MKTQNFKKGRQAIDNMITKCWTDQNFKNQFVNSPVATIEKFTGGKFDLPANNVLKVEDQTDTNIIYLNIPRKIDVNDLQLTEEQLARVAGGEPITLAMIGAGIGCSLAAAAIYDMGGGAYAAFQDFF